MTKFQYQQSVFFEIVPIFYTITNWLILLMHYLVVTIFYCADNHFTSFVAILLLSTPMVYNEFYYICAIHGKNSLLCTYIGLAISISFFLNNEYRISENGKI